MSDYKVIMQVAVIILISLFIVLLGRLLRSIIRNKRIEKFSINSDDDNLTVEYNSFYIVNRFSDFLKRLVIFNQVAKYYEKYVDPNSKKINDGMDIVALEIILGFIFNILYVIGFILYKSEFNILILLCTFILGLVIPDIYFYFRYKNRRKIINNDILKSIIVINNSLKAGYSLEEAILETVNNTDYIVGNEFIKVLHDIKIGLNPSEAFYRMYKRNDLEVIRVISERLNLNNLLNVSFTDIFSDLENELVDRIELNNKVESLKKRNRFYLYVMLILPVIIILGYYINNDMTYVDAIISTMLYIVYYLVLHFIKVGDNNE